MATARILGSCKSNGVPVMVHVPLHKIIIMNRIRSACFYLKIGYIKNLKGQKMEDKSDNNETRKRICLMSMVVSSGIILGGAVYPFLYDCNYQKATFKCKLLG